MVAVVGQVTCCMFSFKYVLSSDRKTCKEMVQCTRQQQGQASLRAMGWVKPGFVSGGLELVLEMLSEHWFWHGQDWGGGLISEHQRGQQSQETPKSTKPERPEAPSYNKQQEQHQTNTLESFL